MDRIQQLLVYKLQEDSGASSIRSIVADRIYPHQIAQTITVTYPCLNFELRAATVNNLPKISQGTIVTWCWSDDSIGQVDEAWRLHRLLSDFWTQNNWQDTVINRSVHIMPGGEADGFFDDEARAYAVVGNWNFWAADIT